MFYGFNLYDNVDNTESYNRILAYTAYGYDWRENSHINPSKTAMLYSRFGATSAGIYIGNSL
ncbi:hypothetical protein N7536_007346 [Penicillium majusculum]|nr:hypothetical protein N7536_007346 [Penicillium majusculum]